MDGNKSSVGNDSLIDGGANSEDLTKMLQSMQGNGEVTNDKNSPNRILEAAGSQGGIDLGQLLMQAIDMSGNDRKKIELTLGQLIIKNLIKDNTNADPEIRDDAVAQGKEIETP